MTGSPALSNCATTHAHLTLFSVISYISLSSLQRSVVRQSCVITNNILRLNILSVVVEADQVSCGVTMKTDDRLVPKVKWRERVVFSYTDRD